MRLNRRRRIILAFRRRYRGWRSPHGFTSTDLVVSYGRELFKLDVSFSGLSGVVILYHCLAFGFHELSYLRIVVAIVRD